MGMSSYIRGFVPADAKWIQMKAAWDACVAAKVEIPREVSHFFNGEYPGDAPGMEVRIDGAIKELHPDAQDVFEVDLSKLPPMVAFIRFTNSY